MKPNRFVFVVPMYNASATLPRMLHSVYGQSYDNWRIELVDDVSTDDTRKTKETLELFRQFDLGDKLNVVWNTEKKWEVANVLDGISRCDDDDIICRLDGDDWLIDLDALAIIDYAYTSQGCDALWTAHRWGFSDRNISAPLPQGADPYKYPWVTSHLKTFRKRLLNNVNDANFRDDDGKYIDPAGDQVIYLPVLHNAQKRMYLPRPVYHYTIDDKPETYHTPAAKIQKDKAMYVRQRGYIK